VCVGVLLFFFFFLSLSLSISLSLSLFLSLSLPPLRSPTWPTHSPNLAPFFFVVLDAQLCAISNAAASGKESEKIVVAIPSNDTDMVLCYNKYGPLHYNGTFKEIDGKMEYWSCRLTQDIVRRLRSVKIGEKNGAAKIYACDFSLWTYEKLVYFCIAMGCDYFKKGNPTYLYSLLLLSYTTSYRSSTLSSSYPNSFFFFLTYLRACLYYKTFFFL
jgi:hypothetical protein